MFELNSDGKWYCTTHNCVLELCRRRVDNVPFLRCPCGDYHECGTKSITEKESSKYDYYTPNYNNALIEKMREKVLDDECDYFNAEDFGF